MWEGVSLSVPSTVSPKRSLHIQILTSSTGGNDVFVDIGDKSWGVLACQRFFGGIDGSKTLHVGDQFLSAGANDFKARLACTTAWIANPAETCALLDEIAELDEMQQRKQV